MQIEPLYCDNHLLFIHKPAGLLAQADHSGAHDALTEAKAYIKQKYNKPGEAFLGLVHRLDRPVSGVMVFARTSKAARRLFSQFKERTVEKKYIAIVEGMAKRSGHCEHFLLRKEHRVEIVDAKTKGAQSATLSWQRIATNGKFSLVEIKLETGRKHQIRVQLAANGNPILGDQLYGAKTTFTEQAIALHAYSLAVVHPTKKERVVQVVKPAAPWFSFFQNDLEKFFRTKK